MKVWELIGLLQKRPAGDEVQIGFDNTYFVEVQNTQAEDGSFSILGGDPMVIDDDGEEVDYLSNLADRPRN